jgi:membrane protein DedA with SNARE-associated domain
VDFDFLKRIVDLVVELVVKLGYPGLFGMILVESTGAPVPGQIGIFFGGYLAQTGRMNAVVIVAVTTLAHTTGNSLAYWLAKKYGRLGLERFGKYLFISSDKIDRADSWFSRYGNWSLLLGELTPYLRDYISYPAGMLKLPYRRFLPVVLVATLVWNSASVFLGYIVASHWRDVADSVSRYFLVWICAVAVIGLLLGILVPRFKSRHSHRTTGTR